MNLSGTARATRNSEFQDRVQAAVVLTALDIVNEKLPLGDPKGGYALRVLSQPEYAGRDPRFLWLVASNVAIANSVQEDGTVEATDNDIHYVVAGAWSTLFPEGGDNA